MEGIKGERNEQQSDRVEHRYQNGLYLGRFEVEKVTFFIKHASCLYLELCFLPERGAIFRNIVSNKSPESEKWSHNNIGYIKILPKWCRIHQDVIKIMSDTPLKSPKEATCSNNTHICKVF